MVDRAAHFDDIDLLSLSVKSKKQDTAMYCVPNKHYFNLEPLNVIQKGLLCPKILMFEVQ
jgi:hypothetical protein